MSPQHAHAGGAPPGGGPVAGYSVTCSQGSSNSDDPAEYTPGMQINGSGVANWPANGTSPSFIYYYVDQVAITDEGVEQIGEVAEFRVAVNVAAGTTTYNYSAPAFTLPGTPPPNTTYTYRITV